jgi:hypothetical protein
LSRRALRSLIPAVQREIDGLTKPHDDGMLVLGRLDLTIAEVEQRLTAATMGLPAPVARSMREALSQGTYRIRAGRYSDGDTVCPLGAADAFAAGHGMDEWSSEADSFEGYGGSVMRFAISFDLCAAKIGLDAALEIVKGVLPPNRRMSP